MRNSAPDNIEMKQNSRQLALTWQYKRYKEFENELRMAATKWFSQKGYARHSKMHYCLASHKNWIENIVCKDVVEYISYTQKMPLREGAFSFHKYLHHGLSSQAMIFNLLGPLVVRNDLDPLKTALNRVNIDWPTGNIWADFEYTDRKTFNEDAGQPTSIDFIIAGQSGSLFLEAKLVEREFGGCSFFSGGDCEGDNPASRFENCYLHHIGRTYWDKMEELGFLSSAIASGSICPFTSYYQFFREVLFALENNGKFILLHDDRNPAFIRNSENGSIQRGLWPFLLQSIPDEHKPNIGRITIQQVVKSIEESGRHDNWIAEFKMKYGLSQ